MAAPRKPPAVATAALAWAVFFLSAGVLGYEIALLRVLLVMSWHHFAFVVISAALLGFGASGTVLAVFRPFALRHVRGALLTSVLATAALILACAQLAQQVPLEARLVPGLVAEQLRAWLLFWGLLALPFLSGALGIGLALMAAGERVPLVYAANLVGSGVGALLAPLLMVVLPIAWLPAPMAALVVAGAFGVPQRVRVVRIAAPLVLAGVAAAWLVVRAPALRIDPFKDLAYVQRLVAQGTARSVITTSGPRGQIGVYRSNTFHDLPFLGTGAAPPALDALLIDGHRAGSVLRVRDIHETAALDHTLMSVPYALLPERPAVALLGETDGVNTWLALRNSARSITAVQPNAGLIALWRGPLGEASGGVFTRDSVRIVTQEPRFFVERTRERFDLIQLVDLQGLSAGAGGMGGLAENHLLTVAGLGACFDALTPAGCVAVCREINTPPRDNVKLLATAVAALRDAGIGKPSDHIVIVRDYLAVCTLVRRTPWTAADAKRVRVACEDRQLTPVWFPGVRADELNQPDALPGPADAPGDWLHYAASRLFADPVVAAAFIDGYVYDIRPPTDDRPFFYDFCKLDSLGAFRLAFGDLWLTRMELAYLFVLLAAGVITAVAVPLALGPLALLRDVRGAPHKSPTALYFMAIGLGYLTLELTWLSRAGRLVGDAVVASAVVIAGFLLFSGVGSALAGRLRAGQLRRVLLVLGALAIVGHVGAVLVGERVGGGPLPVRCLVVLAGLAPLALLLGLPMPLGLRRLVRGAPALVPLAWGVNGFASVLATPLCMLVAMTWGYTPAVAAAAGAYLLALLVYRRLPGADNAGPARYSGTGRRVVGRSD